MGFGGGVGGAEGRDVTDMVRGSSTDAGALRGGVVTTTNDLFCVQFFGGGAGGGGDSDPLYRISSCIGTLLGVTLDLGLTGLSSPPQPSPPPPLPPPLPFLRRNIRYPSSSVSPPPSEGRESSFRSSSRESSNRSSYSPYNASCPFLAGLVRFFLNVVGSNSVSACCCCCCLRFRPRKLFERLAMIEVLLVPTLAVGEPDLLLINVPLDILVELRGDVDDWESEEPQGENGRCRGSGTTMEAE